MFVTHQAHSRLVTINDYDDDDHDNDHYDDHDDDHDDDHGDDAEDDMSEFKLSCTMFVTPGAFKTWADHVGGDGDEINQ